MSTVDSPSVTLTVTLDEALVLFELLQRYSSTESLAIEDQSEQKALWNLCSVLERSLLQPFDANYKQIIERARSRLRDEE